jgi:glycyl-tRNA synthetase beta chain
VREGNERVIRPRLSDADFFWNQDKKIPLAQRLEQLKPVVFQQQLGSLHDKTERIRLLAKFIASQIDADPAAADRCAMLCKTDLMTEMVGEFPELQGIMGCYYARHDGEDEAVAVAINEHYMPRHAGDELPASAIGQAVAIADRMDTIAGIYAIGAMPTGEKDPYALRRAALGVLRIIIECHMQTLSLTELLQHAISAYPAGLFKQSQQAVTELYDFMLDRLRAYYQDSGISTDVFEAVRNLRPARPYDFDQRVHAVNTFRAMPEAESLAAANKRCHNILKQARAEGLQLPVKITADKLKEASEMALARQISKMQDRINPLIRSFDYEPALMELAHLKQPVDDFFDNVMVMDEDPAIRDNRLALLHQLRSLFLQVADVSGLQNH